MCKGSWLPGGQTEGLRPRKRSAGGKKDTAGRTGCRRDNPFVSAFGGATSPYTGEAWVRGKVEACAQTLGSARLPCVKGAGCPKGRLRDCGPGNAVQGKRGTQREKRGSDSATLSSPPMAEPPPLTQGRLGCGDVVSCTAGKTGCRRVNPFVSAYGGATSPYTGEAWVRRCCL